MKTTGKNITNNFTEYNINIIFSSHNQHSNLVAYKSYNATTIIFLK